MRACRGLYPVGQEEWAPELAEPGTNMTHKHWCAPGLLVWWQLKKSNTLNSNSADIREELYLVNVTYLLI